MIWNFGNIKYTVISLITAAVTVAANFIMIILLKLTVNCCIWTINITLVATAIILAVFMFLDEYKWMGLIPLGVAIVVVGIIIYFRERISLVSKVIKESTGVLSKYWILILLPIVVSCPLFCRSGA